MNSRRITWVILIVLTWFSYLSAQSSIGKSSIIALLILVVAKCILVGFQFMELRKAHLFWKIAFLSIFGIFSVLILLIAISG